MAGSSRPTLEELLTNVSQQYLNKPCKNEHLRDIARFITEWQFLASYLKLTKTDVEDVTSFRSPKVQRIKLLETWGERFGQNATYLKLAEAFFASGRVDLVGKIEVECPHIEKGCKWANELKDLKQHLNAEPRPGKELNGCEYVEVSCAHGCKRKFQRHSLQQHMNECSLRLFSYEDCSHTSTTKHQIEIAEAQTKSLWNDVKKLHHFSTMLLAFMIVVLVAIIIKQHNHSSDLQQQMQDLQILLHQLYLSNDTQHYFSEEQWTKLQDDIKEGIYKELQEELINRLTKMLQNTTFQIQNDLHSKITQLQAETESKLNQGITELHSKLIKLEHKIIGHKAPGSCKELASLDPSLPSGYYSITADNGTLLLIYCDMAREGCNSTGGWTRVAFLNMTDPTHQCPSAWREITSPLRTCRRVHSGCDSVVFSTYGLQYSNVLGRITGYQFAAPDGFFASNGDIDSHYMDGVSITRGMPRKHIWSLTADWTGSACPCDSTVTAPSFVGEDYFCSHIENYEGPQFYPDDPLWDGEGCGTNTCCTYNNPPWFCKQLPEATTDDIEIRICAQNALNVEGTPIERVEIYIQ